MSIYKIAVIAGDGIGQEVIPAGRAALEAATKGSSVTLEFTEGAIGRLADFATLVNERTENIGARRLHTVMEKLLDQVSFDAPSLAGRTITIDDAYVDSMLADIVRNEDLSRYIL